ncbi:hypothetical protein [Campylobacter troglodytis]|uniref:hypothetical protein n=1 Tax=Campylobacter troglodytis TaxID=654363 RepID=UPI00115A83AA|nr:hypothetical protein [Campylobacter troglodytis]
MRGKRVCGVDRKSFCFIKLLVPLQEVAKARYSIKYNKNEFAKGRNYINVTVNVFISWCMSCNCKQKGLYKG